MLRIRDVYPGSEFFPSRILDLGSKRFPDHGSAFASKNLSIKNCFYRKYHPGCSSRIRILVFYPPRIQGKKAPDPGSGSATLYVSHLVLKIFIFSPRFVMESSYVPVESLIFGRLAYKGMNAEIENLMLEVGLRRNRSPVWDR